MEINIVALKKMGELLKSMKFGLDYQLNIVQLQLLVYSNYKFVRSYILEKKKNRKKSWKIWNLELNSYRFFGYWIVHEIIFENDAQVLSLIESTNQIERKIAQRR